MTVTREGMLERARACRHALLARAAEAERRRSLPRETFEEVADAGFFRIHQPERHGGLDRKSVV